MAVDQEVPVDRGTSRKFGGRAGVLALVLLLAACQHELATGDAVPVTQATGEATSQAAAKTVQVPPAKPPARAKRYMISAANPHAANAGLEILRAGGNALDAAIAAAMVLTVVEPQSSGIGGGGFLMHYSAKSGNIQAYDGRETAPASAHPYMFLDGFGKPRQRKKARLDRVAVGVPGLLRMAELAHKENGRLPWNRLFKSAIELSEKGFPLSPRLHRMAARSGALIEFPGTSNFFFTDNGNLKDVGTVLRNPELAKTFNLIAKGGADAFYKGPIARDIAAAVNGRRDGPPVMTMKDLASYAAKKRDPACLFYRVWLVCGMPPPTSGGIAALQMLGMLQNFDLKSLNPASVQAVHLIAEASRLAYADRNVYVADPDFVPVPTAALLDPGYLNGRAKRISPAAAMDEAGPGDIPAKAGRAFAPDLEVHGISTSHLSVIDADGDAVSLTASIATTFGSHRMVRGFILNNQLTDFAFAPNKNRKPVVNRVEAGKRPRSSMSPTLVFDGQGKVILAVGSPGGTRIIGYVARTLLAALDWGMDIQAAIQFPNFSHRGKALELEKGTVIEALKPALEKLGHTVEIRRLISGLHGVAATKDGLAGGVDPRREGVALGD